ncbi:bifunctional arginine demethylase and lysyl-hydroxylase PSR isoform X1 [Eurytemora carolleeae]|uniref:bifunctional arginine demethylase and lysyl-hydroxylase PSR isoform X1 n=1 Tax=Eurytemora carolleeae TaxID=1294199 RepID=UPI000C7784FC|nr:bifunctional arginine demethylase and lysyl-hydroxylase PSR isoform X1 [Eurytemora carolleeae]|eukprot:XP_023346240.1 bifunctional arginine demethylase and lysyl-hydroxylase PSR-like isoform X1 [Eurytemora affinis]
MKTVNKKSLTHLEFRDALDIFKNLEGKSKKIPQIFDDIEITRRKCINLRKKCAGIGSSLETGKSFILQRVNLDELVKSEKYETELRLELPRTMEEDERFSGFDAYKNINRCCPQVEADSVSLEKLAEGFQKDGDIHRIPCNIGAETFRDSFIRFNSPSILEGCTKDWKAKGWTVKGLLEIEDGEKDWITNFATKNGDVVDIQEQGKPRRGKEVLEMLKNNSVIRIFDPLAERTSRLRKETNSSTPSDKLELMSHYKVPWSIPEDLFKSCGVLTDYQWIAISSSNTGTDLHLDPVLTSAWNTLLAGRKLWVVLPKDIEINPLSCDPSCSYQQDLSSVSWFQHILPQIRDRKWYGQRILKFIQYTGDTLYIPSRAGHAVLNIDETFAV